METTNITEIAVQYLKTRETVESASIALAELDSQLKEYFQQTGNESIEVDGRKISIVHNKRRSFDITALRNLVSPAMFRKITEPSVKTKLWDSAVALGELDSKVIKKVEATTFYDQLKVK